MTKLGSSCGLKTICLFIVLNSTPSKAVERVIDCLDPKGMSFDLKTPNNGWREELTTVVGISFIKEHEDHYDIIIKYKDKTDIIRPTLNGYNLSHEDESSFSIVVNTRPLGILETFHVYLENDRKGILIWSTMKANTPPLKTTRSSTYTLKCSY